MPSDLAMLVGAALAIALPAHAQPAPNARPLAGSVVAGTASITRSTAATTIDQTTGRAAIDWQSFDVGSQQRVRFNQPSAAAMTLNRVTGPDPSQIAGRITANGQIVLLNQAGVVFYKGAQVNTNGLMVTAAGISTDNFMAGRMVFDQPPLPNAKVENRGEITVRQAGLAALVAPQVANSGVINARLGHVVLAGVQTATLDFYGDGLVSINVTGQVRQAPVGPDGTSVTALVTNAGTIRADGGTVQLTARAADGIVQGLVDAGGRIRADTVGNHAGTIVLNGIGGSVTVTGQITARGRTPGSTGGRIEADSSGDVRIQAGARLDASGRGGGGTIAIGTTLARAQSGAAGPASPTARRTMVAAGASLLANATDTGNGGRVAVLSTDATTMAGSISARGGATAGNGGMVEVSSNNALAFTGTADLSAPAGAPGTILFDPLDLVIADTQPTATTAITAPNPNPPNVTFAGFPDAASNSWISPAVLQALTGNVEVQTTRDLSVQSPLLIGFTTGTGQSLTLRAGRNLTVANASNGGTPSLGASGDVVLQAGAIDPTGAISLEGTVVSQLGSVFLTAPAGVAIDNQVVANATGRNLGSTGKLISIRTDALSFASGTLDDAGGTIEVAPFTSGLAMTVGGAGSGLSLPPLPVVVASGSTPPNLRLGATSAPAGGAPTTTAGAIVIAGPLYAGDLGGADLELDSTGAISQTASLQSVATLSGTATSAQLNDSGNVIATLGPFSGGTAFALNDATALTIAGPLSAATFAVTATGQLTLAGNITSTDAALLVAPNGKGAAGFVQTGAVTITGGGTAVPALTVLLTAGTGSISFANLLAPTARLVLITGSGTATGTLRIAGLLVYGLGGGATLVGSVAGVTTSAAAALGQVVPISDPHYTFNGCTIGLAACAPPTPVPPTPGPPVLPTPSQPMLVLQSTPPMSGGLAAFLPGTHIPMAPALSPVDLTFVSGLPPTVDQLAGPDVVPPNISFQDY